MQYWGHIYLKIHSLFVCDSNLTEHPVFYLATLVKLGLESRI